MSLYKLLKPLPCLDPLRWTFQLGGEIYHITVTAEIGSDSECYTWCGTLHYGRGQYQRSLARSSSKEKAIELTEEALLQSYPELQEVLYPSRSAFERLLYDEML